MSSLSEYGLDPILATNSYQNPPRYYKSNSFPDTPINPSSLADYVSNKLQSFNHAVPSKTPKMVEELCKGFNECIRLNKENELAQTLVYSPKTGSAKSVSAKAYISLLQNESSLVIVPTVEDAITFCEEVNKWRNDQGYAKCYYKVTNINKTSIYLVDKEKITDPSCLVITHAMFKVINQFDDTTIANKIKSRNDALVIVDERLNHYNTMSISDKHIFDIIGLLTKVQSQYSQYDFTDSLSILKQIESFFPRIKNSVVVDNTISNNPLNRKDVILVDYDLYLQLGIDKLIDNGLKFGKIYQLLKDNSIELNKIMNSLSNKSSVLAENQLREDLKQKVKAITHIMNNEFLYKKRGNYTELISIQSIFNGYGSIVVLDATATVNEIYNDLAYYNHMQMMHIETTDPRIYNNLTIHKAPGYHQSRDKIFKSKNPKENSDIAKLYIQLATSLLTNQDDKMLIVTFKDYRPILEAQCINPNIKFTHWGNHIGKNLWSDCNKVMIIGWNYMSESPAYLNYINAIGSIELAMQRIDANTIDEYQKTQLVDDLVQATMRGSARKTIDKNGNCEKCDVYIFQPTNTLGEEVYAQFANEFVGAVEKRWNLTISSFQTKTKIHDKADDIINYLDSMKSKHSDILQKDVRDALGISSSTFSRVIQIDYFQDELKKKGFSEGKRNAKSKVFYL